MIYKKPASRGGLFIRTFPCWIPGWMTFVLFALFQGAIRYRHSFQTIIYTFITPAPAYFLSKASDASEFAYGRLFSRYK